MTRTTGVVLALITVGGMSSACSSTSTGTIEGVVTAIDGDLRSVASFTVITGEGDQLTFEPDPFGDFAFPLPHLGAHMRSLDPVRITYRVLDDDTLLATGVEDA